jgi:hypothetical protein
MRNPACWPALPGASGGEQHILDPSSTVVWSLSRSASASLVARPPLARSCAEEKPEALTSQHSTTSHLLSTYLHLIARLWLLSPSRYSSAFLPYTHSHQTNSLFVNTRDDISSASVQQSRDEPLATRARPAVCSHLSCSAAVPPKPTNMPQDALNSFRSLLDKIPGWITGLDAILDNATQRQNELLSANQPADSDRTLVRKSSKSSSLRSKRSKHDSPPEQTLLPETVNQMATPVPTLLRPQLPHMTESDALRLSQRKRKTSSNCSGDQSGPSKYRSRALVVVYYDGDVQKSFTELVHALASSRNDIRRSKLSAKVDNLARSRSSSSGSDTAGSFGEDTTKSIGTFTYKTTRLRLQDMSAVSRPDGSQSLSKVDGLLEQSQNLCEHAAHQVLRDGDCALEATKAKELLVQARACAEREMPSLEKIAAADQERRVRAEEKQRVERSKQPPPPADSEKIELLSREPSNDTLEVDEIEVDDDDDDSDAELDMTTLKLPPNLAKYTMRSTRLTAC